MLNNFKKLIQEKVFVIFTKQIIKNTQRKAIITFTNELLKEIDTRVDEYTEKSNDVFEDNPCSRKYYNGKIDALNENYFMILKLKDGFLNE